MIARVTQIVIVLSFICIIRISGQNVNIEGRVFDEQNQPLAGVTVQVPNSTLGTITNSEGYYIIQVPQNTKTLSFSFVGMKTKIENIEGRTIVNVVLQEADNILDQIVVTGYGSMRKKDLTGAVSSIRSDELEGQIMTSIQQGLQGRVSGVNINQSDASPGGGLNITIRGSNSLIGGTEPLYIVDGFPIDGKDMEVKDEISQGNPPQNTLNFLNPSDIESIDILKDASSTAIYGSRGANGVVLITTKSGQNQKAEISVNHTLEVGDMLTRPQALSAYDFTWLANTRKIVNDVFYGGIPYEKSVSSLPYQTTFNGNGSLVKGSPEDYKNGIIASTDWIDVITRTGISTRTLLSTRGGSNDFKYYFSGGYDNVKGIVEATDFQRYSFASNINLNMNKNLSLSNSFNLSYTTGKVGQSGLLNGDNAGILMLASIKVSPLILLQDEYWDEEFGEIIGSDNPYVQATKFKELNTGKALIERLALNYKFHESLSLNISGGVSYRDNIKDMYYPKSTLRGDRAGGGRAFYGTNASYTLLNDYMLTFNKKIKKHAITLTGVYSLEYLNRKAFSTAVSGFMNDILENYNFSAANDYYKPSSSQLSVMALSGIGRVNYNYDDRYLLTASIRADGNSKFGANNKWGYFPSIGLAWRLVEEKFLKHASSFSDLKLRASFGVTGNAGLGAYQSIPLMDITTVAFNNVSYMGMYNSNIPNPDLKWERTNQTNFGIDIGLFNNRLYFTADAYDKTTYDLLQNLRLPASAGFRTRIMNIGTLQNRGLELLLKADILKQKNKLNWNISANWSTNKSKILSLGNVGSYRESIMIEGWDPFYVGEGAELGLIYGYKVSNIIKTQEDLANAALDNPNKRIGEYDYVKDENGFMKEMVLGNTNPDFIYGFSTQFKYKNLVLNANFSGSVGNDIINVQTQIVQNRSLGTPNVIYNYWIPEIRNSAGDIVIPDNGKNGLCIGYPDNTVHDISKLVDHYVEDGSFFKMNNISLSYVWNPGNKMKFIKRLTPMISVNNLFMITNYSGVNPETSVYGQDPIRKGVAYYEYPLTRSFAFTINCVFN